MRLMMAFLLLSLPPNAVAACVDWKAMGKFADVEAASLVFEGTVERVDLGDVATCAPERVTFTATRLWKGQPETQYTLLQDNGGRLTEAMPDGRLTDRGCPMGGESDRFTTTGARYIVFAAGPVDGLRAMGCSTSKTPTAGERQRLDKWAKKAKRQ
jgi:hypothetical protein